jgi:hypothetical protein
MKQFARGQRPLLAVLRIQDVYPGSEFFPSRIRIKEFNPKKMVSKLSEYDSGSSSGIRILICYPSRMSGSKRYRLPDPGSGSATLVAGVYDTDDKLLTGLKDKDVGLGYLSEFVYI